jgi:hypothetical protein
MESLRKGRSNVHHHAIESIIVSVGIVVDEVAFVINGRQQLPQPSEADAPGVKHANDQR